MNATASRFLFGCTLTALLAGCTGSGGRSLPTAAGPAEFAPALGAPNASPLLYVSDPEGNDVATYSYPDGKPVATISFNQPAGMCVSKSGNVFIADPSESHVRVYAHGGTKPLRTLNDSGYNPLSCAVDPKSGNLAVTSYLGSKNHGDLAIYTHAIGAPKVYADANIPHMSYASYDGAGNLFLDGVTSSRKVVVAELPKGGTHIQAIALNQTIANAGGVGWDGTYLDVGDVAASVIYRFKISAGKGTKAGSTPLNGSAYVDEFSIQGTQVIVPDFEAGKVRYYKFPGGGSPVKTIEGFTSPLATTVSN
jgi:hypothetical protein